MFRPEDQLHEAPPIQGFGDALCEEVRRRTLRGATRAHGAG